MLDYKLIVFVLATRNKTKLTEHQTTTSVITYVLFYLSLVLCLFKGCSVFGPQTVRKCLFNCTPASLVSSGAFLDILQKGRAFSLMPKDPDQPENAKSLKVTIVGAPNAGKSTLTNQLLGRKLFADSEKVHTTRSRAVGVLTQDDTQIIGEPLNIVLTKGDAWSQKGCEPLYYDSCACSKLDYEVLKCLALNPDVPAILVLSKVDLLKNKTLLLDITAQLTEGVVVNGKKIRIRGAEKPHQKSAVKPHNRYTEEPHSESGHFLRTEVLTDQGPEEVCISTIREKLLQCLPKEVPHSMTQVGYDLWAFFLKINDYFIQQGCIKLIKKNGYCSGGHMITRITQEAENDVMKIFLREVHLKISAKFRK
uniref:Era-like 12S mitochondrial rRNA chaperone 1 n=2 Tax=Cyprinus carpio TaxID=7962 RepID=A0A9J8CBP7_CYPCA